MRKNHSFKHKIFCIMLIVTLLPTLTISLILYYQAERSVVEGTTQNLLQNMHHAVTTFDSGLQSLTTINNWIRSDSVLVEEIKRANNDGGGEKKERYAKLHAELSSYVEAIKADNLLNIRKPYITNNLHSIYLYLPKQNTVIATDTGIYPDVNAERVDFIKNNEKYAKNWYSARPLNFYTLSGRDTNEKQISFNQYVLDGEDDIVAIYSLNVNKAVFSGVYADYLLGNTGSKMVLGKGGHTISSAMLPPLSEENTVDIQQAVANTSGEQGICTQKLLGQNHYIVYTPSRATGWSYVTALKDADVLGTLYGTKRMLWLMICVTVVVAFVVSRLVATEFYSPIEKLVMGMKQVRMRNLDVRIDDPREDEYRLVYRGFNNMVGELDELIETLATEKMLNKEVKIKLLQEQINPHFLYNTLDSIYSIATLHDEPQISQMVLALSRFFRVSLSGGKDIVKLSEATTIIKNYLIVQNIRFQDKFKVSIDIPKELQDCLVPKLVLQPFVENAIYHGLEPLQEGGELQVYAKRTAANQLALVVEDSGVGMASSKQEELRELLAKGAPSEDQNFAINNVNAQIRLRYGPDYGITIASKEGKGTRVTIHLPIEKE